MHPAAVLIGPASRLILGRGAKIGSRTRIDVGQTGRLVLGEKIWMSSDVEIETATEVRIGRETTIQRRCTINGTTRIGAGCIFAPNVFVSSGTHPFRAIPHLPIREQERRLAVEGKDPGLDRPVWIQDDCWLGTNVVVCPGVTIGKGSVVGANAVVTRDVPPYTVVAGSPACMIGRRLDWQPPLTVHTSSEEDLVYVLSGDEGRAPDGKSIGIILSQDTPLQVVLAAAALTRGVRVHYETPARIEVSAGQGIYALDAGLGALQLPISSLVAFENTAICHLRILPSQNEGVLYITKIETVG